MSYLILIAVTFFLFSGFLVFAGVETRRGARIFKGPRTLLDKKLHRISYIIRHIDWGGFITHVSKVVFERTAHDVVHFTLVAVRSVERTLTRVIRTLRERVAMRSSTELPAEGSPLLHTLVRFHKTRKPEPPKEKPE